MRYGKPASSIDLWPLYSDIIFFVDHYSAGVSNTRTFLTSYISKFLCIGFTDMVIYHAVGMDVK